MSNQSRVSATIERVAGWLREARSAVVFTGAGISTESGIPDFRSPGGVWSRNKPVYYNEFLASADARFEYWRQKAEAAGDFLQAQPNDGHRTIAKWEQSGRVAGVITQNIDGLHQEAGNRRVLELHGTARWVDCVDCGARFEPLPLLEAFRAEQKVPPCAECGGRLKSATISFGQALPTGVLEESVALAESSDLFFAIGSSLVVHPAAGLPQLARRAGARVVIINRDPTDQDLTAAAVLHEPIGATLLAIDEAMQRIKQPQQA
jgi:NAD-dependent deacetylase